MKYVVLTKHNWRVYQSEEELREFLSLNEPQAKFENGLSALTPTWSPQPMLGQLERVIVQVADVIVPVQQEVESVVKATKWILPYVEEKPVKTENKWRRATNDDAGRSVVVFGTRCDKPPTTGGEGYAWTQLRGVVGTGSGQRVFHKDYKHGTIIEGAEAWVYE